MKKVIAFMVALGVLSIASADVIIATGKVVSSNQSTAIEKAIVSVTTGFGNRATTVSDTTGTDGVYTITSKTDTMGFGASSAIIAVSATGFTSANYFATVQNANDSKADTIKHDFTLTPNGTPQPGIYDSLVVKGKVMKADTTAISGATVTIALMGNQTSPQTTATTGTDGSYSVKIANSVGARNILIGASVVGFENSQAYATVEPSDGKKDTVTENFYLTAILYDTLKVSGKVVDSTTNANIQDALIIISYTAGAMASIVKSDSVKTDASGNFNKSVLIQNGISRITWTIEKAGYLTRTANLRVPNNFTLDLGTLKLVKLTTGDSLTYAINGRILDAKGLGIGNANVILTLKSGTIILFKDTVKSSTFGLNVGSYTTHVKLPYTAGDIVTTATVTAANFKANEVSVTNPSSTNTITVNVTLQSATTSLKVKQINTQAKVDKIGVYSLSGRLISMTSTQNLQSVLSSMAPRMSGQSVLIRSWSKGVPVTNRTVVR